ncbi:hypothetical protein, partial [Streptomyces prunicolor]|uniref:hypothetical protein n=1 Tax=Streptomyces prunicolor TaxID=67348 RepID=UPI0033EB5FE5
MPRNGRRQLITATFVVGTLTAAAACSDPSAGQDASGTTTITVALAANPARWSATTIRMGVMLMAAPPLPAPA